MFGEFGKLGRPGPPQPRRSFHFSLSMSPTIQGNVVYDPLPLTNEDNSSTALYNAPPSPDPHSTLFHTPRLDPQDLGVDSTGAPLSPGPRFLGAALYDDPTVRHSYASSQNTGAGGSEYSGSIYALNDTLGAAPLTHGYRDTLYRDDPNDNFVTGQDHFPMSPIGQNRLLEEKRTAYEAPRAKSRRKFVIVAIIIALILLIGGAFVVVYFTVIRHNRVSNSQEPGATATPTSTGNSSTVAAVTGGDGSKVTMEDGTTFIYSNKFGGYWYWDENDPFNNGAQAQSWSPALNETFRYGIDQIRGSVSASSYTYHPRLMAP